MRGDEFQELFFTYIPGTMGGVENHIKTTISEPVLARPFTIPFSVREPIQRDIQDMLKIKIIRESDSICFTGSGRQKARWQQ